MSNKKVKENIAMLAIAQQSPQIRKVMEEHGYKIGENFLAPKAISSLAMMRALEDGGITFKSVVSTLKEAMAAEGYMTKKCGINKDEIYKFPDHKVRLNAIKLFIQMMGIDKGMDIPVPIEDIEDNTNSFVNVKMNFSEPEVLEPQNSEQEAQSQ